MSIVFEIKIFIMLHGNRYNNIPFVKYSECYSIIPFFSFIDNLGL